MDLVRQTVDTLDGREQVDVAGETPVVEVDGGQVQRAIANLIENALKFSPPGASVHVRITATRKEAIVRVVDQGPGLDPAELERVFDPFYRHAEDPRSGAGLGLAIARGFVEANEGRVVGGVAAGARSDLCGRPAGRRDARSVGGPRTMSGQRILVVDDEPQILRALGTMLRGAGYDVDAAATGEAALAAAAARPPEAVILDLVLSDTSGIEVCRELRTWTDVPVIVLSAVGEEREKVAALDAGADDYVTKPFGVDELLARLRAALRRSKPTAEPVIVVGGLKIDVVERIVTRDGKRVKLSPHEFDLLRVLAQNEGKLLTHRMLLREVWGPAYQVEAHYIHVYVSHLRRKIEPDPSSPRYVLTEPGAGYRLVDPDRPPV